MLCLVYRRGGLPDVRNLMNWNLSKRERPSCSQFKKYFVYFYTAQCDFVCHNIIITSLINAFLCYNLHLKFIFSVGIVNIIMAINNINMEFIFRAGIVNINYGY